ncbi:MAG TPA: c-type cytochrome domain-containing protein [Isosphaeraceae bacterium]|jgi:WD40 repeat protein|nr:c-type cytochrome domain-containing protein [Isosphaeraceae bacterium]
MIRSLHRFTLTLAIVAAAALLTGAMVRADDAKTKPPADPNAPVSFYKQVLPILQRKCQGCHQPAKANGKLDLTSFELLVKGGQTGSPIEAGKPDESLLIDNVTGAKPLMPPMGVPMTTEEVDLVTRWVGQGAKDDTPPAAKDTIDADHPPVYAAPPLTTALAFSPDGQTLAISGYREVLIHKADGSGLAHRLVGQAQRIESLTYSPDGTILAAVGGSPGRFGEVQFWDAKTFKLRTALRSTYDTLYGGAFTPDGKRFSFGCADNSARVVEVKDGKETLKIDHHSDWVFNTAFSLDGKHLITLGRDGSIKLTESGTGSFIDDIGKNYGELKVLARHPKENKVVIGGDERIPRLYQIFRTQARDMNYTDFNLLKAFEAQPGPIAALAFSADGNTIAVGGSGGEVRLYNVADGARKQTLKGHKGGIFSIAFSPDNARVATGGFDGTVRIFDAASGNVAASFVPVPVTAPDAVAQADAQPR